MRKAMIVTVFGALLLFLGAAGANAGTIAMGLSVPDTSWKLCIEEVREVNGELWVVARTSSKSQIGAQMITMAGDSVKLDAPDLPKKYFVIGKTWNWENSEPYEFIKDRDAIAGQLDSGKLLFQADK